jgi:hypothetical protein
MDDSLVGQGRLYRAFGDLPGHLPDGSVPDDALGANRLRLALSTPGSSTRRRRF